MSPTAPPMLRPDQLAYLYQVRAANAIFASSVELGVLDRLARGPVEAEDLARECGIREEIAPALLNALASLGLAEPSSHGSFVGVTDELPDLLAFLHRFDAFTDGLLRRPEPPPQAPPGADEAFGQTVRPLANLCAAAIPPAIEHLGGAGPRVLDLGAGAAPWSLALAGADPEVVVTAVDLPAVLPVTRRAVAAAGREAQFRFVESDMFSVALEEAAFDLVILGSVCHLFDDATNRVLLGRVARWLAPGGTAAVIDFLPNERRDGPREVVVYAVDLVRRMPAGGVYPFSAYAGWLRESGFEGIERVELASCPQVTLVRGRRPGQPSLPGGLWP